MTVKFWDGVFFLARLPYIALAWPFTSIWRLCHGASLHDVLGLSNSSVLLSPSIIRPAVELDSATKALMSTSQNSVPNHQCCDFDSDSKHQSCMADLRSPGP